ncbi:BgTH12-00864 [Blumeria graminis f. sp. triticale]|uniref:BgTH12-00864 n=1 Tax=Blumeria graminis f. sp. triticale TaxID=1689686 RepID=A0A9W4GHY4_BLUGR|nr:BgTH12-00864 [Blumeria graminis f. sp. triticale]
MYSQTAPLLILALFFVTVFTAPLNINMGNYSPAMVVGDGAIAFHDTDGAANLMASLQGADVEDDDNAGAPQFQPVQAGVEGIGRKAILSSVSFDLDFLFWQKRVTNLRIVIKCSQQQLVQATSK